MCIYKQIRSYYDALLKNIKSYVHVCVPRYCHINTQFQGDIYINTRNFEL